MDINKISIDEIGLSVRSKNALHGAGIHSVAEMCVQTEDSLTDIRNLGKKSINEILKKIDEYTFIREAADSSDSTEFVKILKAAQCLPKKLTVNELSLMKGYHDVILKYVKCNDVEIEHMGLSNRSKNRLLENGFKYLSDIILINSSEFLKIPAMGKGSVDEICEKINTYLSENETRIMKLISGDESALWDDETICRRILELFGNKGFGGFSFEEIMKLLKLPEEVTQKRIKEIIGKLIGENQLEYVDYYCYRVHGKFEDELIECTNIDERSRDFIIRRMCGETLEGIARDYNLTRERVRQIVKRDIKKVHNQYEAKTGTALFDEDYYSYFYENYEFDKIDAAHWLGVPEYLWNYFELNNIKQGNKSLESALEDYKGLDVGLRLKIKNYLNRDKIFIDGIWVDKTRIDLEEVVVRKFCQENVSFIEFVNIYNKFLEHEDILYDDSIYITKDVYRTRKRSLSESRYVLWKQNEMIRYYDIDSRDYSELFDTLNLDSYENVELSTLKFVREYPEILEKYDIRDQYELHNLFRKIISDGSYHDFRCGRMPNIKFGKFDRDRAILDILIENSPISVNELTEIISYKYGYDSAVIAASYLQCLTQYYYKGIYTYNQKKMSDKNKSAFKKVLIQDFYYINELKNIYKRTIPGANIDDINPYNLKSIGFQVFSGYVLQNYPSLEVYFNELLTEKDIIDITPYRKRYVYVQVFSQKLMDLKRSLFIIEFEPNNIINFRKLKKIGITKELISDYCDAVYKFIDDKTYFSVQSLKNDGFDSELYSFGFSDWFYANLLISDERFSYSNMFGNLIFYKGKEAVTIKSFVTNLIRQHGCIYTNVLLSELEKRYGCRISDKWDVTYKVKGTEIYHDKTFDRLYANKDLYYRELEMK